MIRILFLTLFINCFVTAQNFDIYYKQAESDYYNLVSSDAFDKAIESCPDIKKYPELLIYKGADLLLKGEDILAAKYFELASNYTKKDKNICLLNRNLGLVYLQTEDYIKAKEYFEVALEKAEKIKWRNYIVELQVDILLTRLGIPNEAPTESEFWNFYNNLPKEIDASKKFQYINIFLEFYLEIGRLTTAKKFNSYLLENFDFNKLSEEDLSFFHTNNTVLELNNKNYTLALKHCEKAHDLFKKQVGFDYVETYKLYKDIYTETKQHDIALKYADSISILERQVNNKYLKTGITLTHENALFKKVQSKIKKQNNTLKIFLIIAGISVSLVLILLFLSQKARKKLQSKTNFYVEKYNALWSSHQLSIKQLEKLKEELINQKESEVKHLARDISLHLNTNTNDEHKHINMLKDRFINSLKEKAPYLNSKELLICFFIRLNLSHKKIGELLNKTEKSIDSYKYRINTKVKNHHKNSIDELLQSIENK